LCNIAGSCEKRDRNKWYKMEFHTQKNSKTEERLFHLTKVVLFMHSRSINLFNLIQNITERKVKRVLDPKR